MSLEYSGAPGPGGSLGECALCGESFLAEIMLGEAVKNIRVGGCDQPLYAHEKCIDKLDDPKSFDVTALPEKSILRRAYEAQSNLPNAQREAREGQPDTHESKPTQ